LVVLEDFVFSTPCTPASGGQVPPPCHPHAYTLPRASGEGDIQTTLSNKQALVSNPLTKKPNLKFQ